MQSLPRFRATRTVKFPGGQILESHGTVMIEGRQWWFHPEDTSPSYGYWVKQCDTVLGGALPPVACECQAEWVCPACYDDAVA